MTDERLIEEIKAIATKAALEVGGYAYPGLAAYDAAVLAATAVFEKALGEATVTPTDDEREALVTLIDIATNGTHPPEDVTIISGADAYYYADRILAAGFHRSEPEPSADDAMSHYIDPADPFWQSHPEPQGEPSDAHKIIPWSPTGRINSPVSCQACGRSLFIGHSGDWEHVPQRTATAQSEPSDAPTPEEWREYIDAERLRQTEYGYDRAHDDRHGVDHLLTWAQDYARRGKTVASAALVEAAREMLSRSEPTKYEEDAAIGAYIESARMHPGREHMRAALRAASEAGGEGR